jgi:hypothetical protein
MSQAVDNEAQHTLDDVIAAAFNALQSLQEHDKALGTTVVPDLTAEVKEAVESLITNKMELTKSKQAFTEALTQVGSCCYGCSSETISIPLHALVIVTVPQQILIVESSDEEEEEDCNERPKKEKEYPDGDAVYQDILQGIHSSEAFDAKTDSKYMDFKELLESRGDREDEDLQEVRNQVTTIPIDPYNKKEIEFAVRNKKCKHIYDKTSFEQQVTQTRKPRCPYIGCNNREEMSLSSVEVDLATNALIEKIKSGRS